MSAYFDSVLALTAFNFGSVDCYLKFKLQACCERLVKMHSELASAAPDFAVFGY